MRQHITEDSLFWAHRAAADPEPRGEPCACGGLIVADPDDPGPGVARHQLSDRHRRWREREGL